MDIPSAPGRLDVGGTERRDSGRAPEAGGGGAEGRGAGMEGGGALGRRPIDDGDRVEGTPLPRGADSGARVGGGTKARRAIAIRRG
jgi:hypothetical protein